ncbi:hypothetical protein MJD09_14850 [bacterium]|nr:hypothetical protein [bacterium]
MSKQNKRRLLALIIVGAIVCYSLGFVGGLVGLTIVLVLFELAFWVGVFRIKNG